MFLQAWAASSELRRSVSKLSKASAMPSVDLGSLRAAAAPGKVVKVLE